MDPYAKAFRLSLTLHAAAIGTALLMLFFGEIFRPRPTAIFTVMAPPSGLIAGGPQSQKAELPNIAEIAPQGPKLAAPAPQEVAPKPKAIEAAPKPNFVPKAPPKAAKKETPKAAPPKPAPKAEKLSYADFQKKYAPKTTPKKQTKPATKPSPKPTQSLEESFASRLSKRNLETPPTSAGTGSGGTPGSGQLGNGIAGATMDREQLYIGALYTYLNSVWQEPKDLGGLRLFCNVEFVVDRSGTIKSWRLTRRSGVNEFDQSVARVFEKVREVPAPPQAMDYRLTVTFETREN